MRNALVLPVFLFALAHAQTERVRFQSRVFEQSVGWGTAVYAIGDIDGDGKNDIVSGGYPDLFWRKYPAVSATDPKYAIATFASWSDYQVGYEIHLADVDRDGDLDLMTSGKGITWYENPRPAANPASGVWKVHSFGSEGRDMNGGAHDFKIGDINNDGKIDAVEREQGWGQWLVYLQQTPTTWTTFRVNAAVGGEGTCLADIDKDGDLDLTDGWAWYECPPNPATGTWTKHDVGNPTHTLTRAAVADLNGDGRPDIVSCPTEFGGSSLIWWAAPADPKTGAWMKNTLVNYNDPNFHTLQVGDIDNDGNVDIFTGSTAYHGDQRGRLLWIFYNTNGKASAWVEQKWTGQTGCWQGIIGDVGSDGDLDIIAGDYAGGPGILWENMLPPVSAGLFVSGRSAGLARPGFRRIADITGSAWAKGRSFDARGRTALPLSVRPAQVRLQDAQTGRCEGAGH